MIRLYICIFGSILQVHNCSPILTEQFSLQQFVKVVTGHFVCEVVFDAELLLFDAVSDEKILHVNVTDFLSTRILPVLLHEDGPLVILVYNIIV